MGTYYIAMRPRPTRKHRSQNRQTRKLRSRNRQTRKRRSKNRRRTRKTLAGGTPRPAPTSSAELTEEDLEQLLGEFEGSADDAAVVGSPTEQAHGDIFSWLDDVDSPVQSPQQKRRHHFATMSRASQTDLTRTGNTPAAPWADRRRKSAPKKQETVESLVAEGAPLHPGEVDGLMKALGSAPTRKKPRCTRVEWCKKNAGHPAGCSKMPQRYESHEIRQARWRDQWARKSQAQKDRKAESLREWKAKLTPAENEQRLAKRRKATCPERTRIHRDRCRQRKLGLPLTPLTPARDRGADPPKEQMDRPLPE